MELEIHGLGSTGEGVGVYKGLKIFVEGALPGERVKLKITEQKKNYARAQLLEILEPSPQRNPPQCPLFGECGGCQLMHLSYDGQLEAKRQRVVDALQRIGRLSPTVQKCLPSPLSLGYRNKIQLPIIWDGERGKVGLYRRNSHDIIPIESCLIQSPLGEEILKKVQPLLKNPSLRYLIIRCGNARKEALLILVTSGGNHVPSAKKILQSIPPVKGVVETVNPRTDNVILGKHFTQLAGHPYLYEHLLGKEFRISAPSFFQVNSLQAEHLFSQAIHLAELSPQKKIVDAYCGVGTLALLAAEKAHSVLGIECVSHAIADAEFNAQQNGITNCRFVCGQAEREIEPADVVFLNPPRKGCAAELLTKILHLRPETVIYISCDPATLARDLAILCADVYDIEEVIPFDMFPQTVHVETLVKLALLTKSG